MPGKLPQSLCIDIRDRRVLLFVGAGLSQEAGGPSWPSLLSRLVALAEKEQIDLELTIDEARALAEGPTTHKLALADLLETKLGGLMEDHLHALLSPLKPTKLHQRLVGLPWAGYVTTNYDRLIESAVQQRTGTFPLVIYPDDYNELSHAGNTKDGFVLKLHGGIERKRTIALSGRKVDDISDEPAIPSTLARLFGTSATLFIGYGLGDEYVLDELRRLTRIFKGSTKRHYAILPQSKLGQPLAAFLLHRYNLQAIPYDDSNGHTEALSELLGELEMRATGQPERDQLLLLLGSPFSGGLGTDGRVLATRALPGWTTGDQGSWMLPATDAAYKNGNETIDSVAVERSIATMFGVPVSELHVKHIEGPFSSLKLNPRFQEEMEYRFRICFIEIRSLEFWRRVRVSIAGTDYEWIRADEFIGDSATKELNADVVQLLTDICGVNMTAVGRVFPNSVPLYHVSPGGYLNLPWATDNRSVVRCVEALLGQLTTTATIIDIGCGTASLGSDLAIACPTVRYVGIDRSSAMIEVAKQTIGSRENVQLFVADGEDFDYEAFGLSIAVCSNLLETVSRPVTFLSRLKERAASIEGLIISDVESTNAAHQIWAEELFEMLRLGHKRRVFGNESIAALGGFAGWRVATPIERSEHRVHLDSWLASLACSMAIAKAAEEFVLKVKADNANDSSDPQAGKMLRRNEVTIGFVR